MMSKLFRSALSIVLVVSLLLMTYAPVYAVADEEYLSDLRLIYAEDYDEALDILAETDFADYTLLDENLNEDTGETGVFIAYKTTTDIDDAITDLAVMQMQGGYQKGNYQEMIKQSYTEYEQMSAYYKSAIEYFNTAYDAGHPLTELAYRQLNFYTIQTDANLDKKYISKYEDELLGDVFYNGVDNKELATFFMEGNTYVLQNIRSLLALGTSYNEDGLTYMQKVAAAAEEMTDDPDVFADEDFDDLAKKMSSTLSAIRTMFEELEAYEDDLNYSGDEEVTDEELEYAEHMTLANMMRAVNYLDGKTLYEFVKNYTENKSDYSKLYPLVAALNEGQVALVEVLCYYSVIRYSMSDFPVDYLDEEVSALEETYSENPLNIYAGVDRTVFKGTFALTTAASRNDAYNDKYTLADAFFGSAGRIAATSSEIVVGAGGIGLLLWGAYERGVENSAPVLSEGELILKGKEAFQTKLDNTLNAVGNQKFEGMFAKTNSDTLGQSLDKMLENSFPENDFAGQTFYQKFEYLQRNIADAKLSGYDQIYYNQIESKCMAAKYTFSKSHNQEQFVNDYVASATSTGGLAFSTMLFIVGGAMLFASAFSIIMTFVSYYYPGYEDIPLEMVDLIETEYGDRYIKYDVVREAVEKKDGVYAAGDLNGFAAQRWNALYFTKSYEAGKPLLADEFVVSNSNNKAKTGYTPVHGFGKTVCYNLNEFNFDDDTEIYLSVKQSKEDKSAVADVPQVVGSIFSSGMWILAAGIGAVVGIGGTLATQSIGKKKKKGDDNA